MATMEFARRPFIDHVAGEELGERLRGLQRRALEDRDARGKPKDQGMVWRSTVRRGDDVKGSRR